jgi:hypothetical protein
LKGFYDRIGGAMINQFCEYEDCKNKAAQQLRKYPEANEVETFDEKGLRINMGTLHVFCDTHAQQILKYNPDEYVFSKKL